MSAIDPIRVLVVDDELAIREAYCEVLASAKHLPTREVDALGARLFGRAAQPRGEGVTFEVHTADRAEAGVDAVREQLSSGARFDVVFLDMRMPPGPDGAWAAAQIRALDADVDIVIATAFSDVDPSEVCERIPPAEKLFYLQKPFHAHEVRQLVVALGHKARSERYRQLASADSLTGLPNRYELRERLALALAAAKRADRSLAVMFVDLDNFKRINDTLGHGVGDDVLRLTARLLRDAVRESDSVGRVEPTLGRLGGDEFMVLLPEVAREGDAAVVAERIARALAQPISVAGQEIHVSVSIGIASYPGDADDPDTLLRNADLAMYAAKRSARGSFKLYDARMNAVALKQATLETQLRGALKRGEFSLRYQPQLELRSGRVSGLEALLRWRNVALGEVPPVEFIPVAEESGLIVAIGDWVLRTACGQAQAWLRAGLPLDRVAVNVSPVQLAQPGFPASVAAALGESGLPPERLELELTETALVENLERAGEVIASLRALRVGIAIDDFGVGHSNINHVKQLAIDRLKIDRSFVTSLEASERDRAICAAIIAMAHSLNLKVTAEGVEDEAQLGVLAGQQCDEAQGFFIARPLSPDLAGSYLREFGRGRGQR